MNLRREVFDAYGGKCVCCEESELAFLTIDHVHGHGGIHRRVLFKGGGGSSLYRWLKKNDYPEWFQVLCANCNQAKGAGRTCPHQLTPKGKR